MPKNRILTFIILIVLIFCVGFFTSSETAYLSLPRLKLRAMLEERRRGAKRVARLKAKMDLLLTTVLVGTNFLNSLASAIATALAIDMLGKNGAKIAPFVTAFFITTFAQIIPKTAAGLAPDKFAILASWPLSALEKIFFPIVWLFSKLSGGAVKIVEKIIKPAGPILTEEELKTLIDVGSNEGTIEKDESALLNKIIKFNDMQVKDVMKHRSQVSMISDQASYDEVLAEFERSGFSTLTVYKGSRENVVGVLNYKAILFGEDEDGADVRDASSVGVTASGVKKTSDAVQGKVAASQSASSSTNAAGFAGRLMSPVLYVPGTFSVLDLLNKFRQSQHKFAVALDEQGQTAGIITMEDITRVVFGRMTDENTYDSKAPEDKIQLISINTFLVPGDMKIDDVNEILNLHLQSEDMNTIGGWLLEKMGYLPNPGMVFIENKIIYTAEDVSQRRIVSVRIKM